MLEKIATEIKGYKDDDTLEITPATTFEELGLDSLDFADLAMRLEDNLGVANALGKDIKSVGDLLRLLGESA
jgi:acyl carrier protein